MPIYDFIALDFETANESFNSACSIGIAAVLNGEIKDTFYSLINPNCSFDPKNIEINGISQSDVSSAPEFYAVWKDISKYFGQCAVLAHNAQFDMSVLKCSHPFPDSIPDFKYIDTISLCKEFVPGEKNLAHCAEHFCIDMGNHHNALDDAITCAKLAICCIENSEFNNLGALCFAMPNVKIHNFSDLTPKKFTSFKHQKQLPYSRIKPADIKVTVENIDPTGPLCGKSVVFTGELSMERSQAMQLAVNAGGIVKTSVSKKTDYLVVGKQDLQLVGEDGMSTKEEKAYALNSSGSANIKIIDEATFLQLVEKLEGT